MADKEKISELTETIQVSDSDYFPVVKNGSTLRTLMSTLSVYINTKIPITEYGRELLRGNTSSEMRSTLGLPALFSAKQDALGYIPIQQNGGTLQGANRIRIGWGTDGSQLRVMVDATDFANVWPISIAGNASSASVATKLATARNLTLTGDGSWSTSFDGSANATAAFTLANSGVTAGTYGSVTVDAKGRATAGTVATPIANGGTGGTTAATARNNLGVLSIADKPAWTTFTPNVTANSGTFTTVSATGKYLVVFGICYMHLTITVTTKGTGALPKVSLPFTALAGALNYVMPAAESSINGKLGKATIISGLATVLCSDYANADLVTGDGAVINICGSYPIA